MGLIMRKRHSITKNDDNDKQVLLDSLSKEPLMVISTAYVYAKNYVNYGEDITKVWTTAVQQAYILEKVEHKARIEAYDSFKKEYEARLQADMEAIFTELKNEMNSLKECEQQIYGKENWNFVRKCQDVIQQKIDALKESAEESRPEVLYDKTLAAIRNYAKSKEGEENGIHEN